jgi:uncharacterized protein YcbX
MALFHCELSSSTIFSVSYHTPHPAIAPPCPGQQTTVQIPFEPDSTSLVRINITLHTAPSYPAYRMSESINTWFSDCFGYKVVLAYLGDGLGIPRRDEKTQIWMSRIKPIIPKQVDAVNFSDGAALLVTSEDSLADLHPRLDGEKAVLEKFRPNIVVDGPGVAWDEDFWGELTVTRLGVKLVLTSNCARCTSINVDLEKGRMADGESGKLLKKMMRDRRIDPGNKWTPIFGRYGFPTASGEIKVGDEVVVSTRNSEHTVWSEYSCVGKLAPLADCGTDGVMPRLTKLDGIVVQ